MNKLVGRVALVTGAASGMGRASAIALAAEGAQVVLGDVNDLGLEQSAAEITSAGGDCQSQHFDALLPDSCKELVAATLRHYGRIDIVANVAGISGFYTLDELDVDVLNRYLAINTTSAIAICCEAIPHLRKTKGCIINFASINAKTPVPFHTAYCASKAAIMAATKCMALELAVDEVRANVISPGGFDTPMNDGVRIPEAADLRLIVQRCGPTKRLGAAAEAARVVVFLASDDASYISGADLTVDGGTQSSL